MLDFELGDRLRAASNRIADATLAQRPRLLDRYGETGRLRYQEDIQYNLAALAAALDAGDSEMFLRYVRWRKIVLLRRAVASDDIAESLRCMKSALTAPGARDHSIAASYLQGALQQLDKMTDAVASFIGSGSEEHLIAHRCMEALLRLDEGAARKALEDAVAAGLPLARIYGGIFPPLMREIGRLWQMNEISVAHEHYCSAAVQSILSSFYSRLFGGAIQSCGRSILVACVQGEQHELGARTVADVFALNGWRTAYFGANLPPLELVRLLEQARRKPDLIALSATMPGHLVKLAATIAALRDSSNIPILVGGYLFLESPKLAARMGVAGCGDDAEAAVALANALVDRARAGP